jgi:hypothetical protein
MPSKAATLRELAGRVAASRRWRRPDAVDLAHELAVERFAAKVERFVTTEPLTDAEAIRLVDTLLGRPSGHEPSS